MSNFDRIPARRNISRTQLWLLVSTLLALSASIGCRFFKPASLLDGTDSSDVSDTGFRNKLEPANSPVETAEIGGMRFSRIPAGDFLMGATELVVPLENGHCETPAHRVVISTDFWMSQTEVTVGQFRRFVHETDYRTEYADIGLGCNSLNLKTGQVQQLNETQWDSPGFGQTNEHPVVCVSHGDATAYCEWLSKIHGRAFRLPSEAEWEYACRAGSESTFSTGNNSESLQGAANIGDVALRKKYGSAEGTAPWNDGFPFTAPVGSFRPNDFGLFDMHGNVGEWCSDWFDAEYYKTSPTVDPTGPKWQQHCRVVRGGSWYNTALSCRSSGRHDGIETAPSTTNGFRVVLEVLPEEVVNSETQTDSRMHDVPTVDIDRLAGDLAGSF